MQSIKINFYNLIVYSILIQNSFILILSTSSSLNDKANFEKNQYFTYQNNSFSYSKKASKLFKRSSYYTNVYSDEPASSPKKFIPEKNLNFEDKNSLIVSTSSGKILGITLPVNIIITDPNDKSSQPNLIPNQTYFVNTFYGIPYGKAPIGELRFKRSQPVENWNNFVYNATKQADACVQLHDTYFGNFRGSTMWNPITPLHEDCLTINIWVTQDKKENEILPVMIWIYGGGFSTGSTALEVYDGSVMAARGRVVVASINYRASSLGFLYLNRTEAPGNVGLYDQVLAMKWIKSNIINFGGDPNEITLFGESSGAASISFHLLSKVSENLFKRAILSSGAPTCPWAYHSHVKAIYQSLRLAENLNCLQPDLEFIYDEKTKKKMPLNDLRRYASFDYQNDKNIIKCLQSLDPLVLLKKEWVNTSVIEFPFVPVVDGVFLEEEPAKLLVKHKFKKNSILLGSVENEAHYFLVYHLNEYLNIVDNVNLNYDQFKKIIEKYYINQWDPDKDYILDAILQQYSNWEQPNNSDKNLQRIDHLFGDYKFTCHVVELSKHYTEAEQQVYMYYFTHRSSRNPWPKWMGVLHADEINYILGEPLKFSYNYTNSEIRLSERMLSFWVNFAKTGNPLNQGNSLMNESWPMYTSDNKVFKYLNTNLNQTTGIGLKAQECAFWLDYIPKLRKKLEQRIVSNSYTYTNYLSLMLIVLFFYNLLILQNVQIN